MAGRGAFLTPARRFPQARLIDLSTAIENDVPADPPTQRPTIETLANLEARPPAGFTVSCFPVTIRGASAGWTRAVAILPE